MGSPSGFFRSISSDFDTPVPRGPMTATDLGVIDQDEKIGMEPPCVFLPLMRKPSNQFYADGAPNPLDGTRLWDNS